jgi:hypothetical protein
MNQQSPAFRLVGIKDSMASKCYICVTFYAVGNFATRKKKISQLPTSFAALNQFTEDKIASYVFLKTNLLSKCLFFLSCLVYRVQTNESLLSITPQVAQKQNH